MGNSSDTITSENVQAKPDRTWKIQIDAPFDFSIGNMLTQRMDQTDRELISKSFLGQSAHSAEKPTPKNLLTFQSVNGDESEDEKDQVKSLKTTKSEKNNKPIPQSSSDHSTSQFIDYYISIFQQRHPSKLNAILMIIFVIVLIIGTLLIGVEYVAFRESVTEIHFTSNVLKASYERLDSLVWIYRYVVIYRTRVEGLVAATTTAELNRFGGILRHYRNIMRNANGILASTISTGNHEQQVIFFEKNIQIDTRDDISIEVDDNLYGEYYNSFDIVKLFIEKLLQMDSIPVWTLYEKKNPYTELIRRNLPNDLLISSERMIDVYRNALWDKLHTKKQTLTNIFIVNCFTIIIAIFLILIHFWRNHEENCRFFRALLNIHNDSIKNIIIRLSSFSKVLTESEENSFIQKLQRISLANFDNEVKRAKQMTKDYTLKGIVLQRIKRTTIVILLLISTIGIFCGGYITIVKALDKLSEINNRIIVVTKARYEYNLAIASVTDLILTRNTTSLRNVPIAEEVLKTIAVTDSGQYLIDAFTNKKGEHIDPIIESLFNKDLCSYVVDFPFSNNTINCPRQTFNSSFGLLGINNMFSQDLNSISQMMLSNLTFNTSQKALSLIITSCSRNAHLLSGGFLFMGDYLAKQLLDAVNEIKRVSPTALFIELSAIILINILCIWIVVKKVLDDKVIRMLLMVVPYEQVERNQLLKYVIVDLYKEKAAFLKRR